MKVLQFAALDCAPPGGTVAHADWLQGRSFSARARWGMNFAALSLRQPKHAQAYGVS
jgi:hypothetical protein